jgi:hypothetical protein
MFDDTDFPENAEENNTCNGVCEYLFWDGFVRHDDDNKTRKVLHGMQRFC